MTSNLSFKSNSLKVTIFHYPFQKTGMTNKRVRKRNKIYLEVNGSTRKGENKEKANTLRKRILLARNNDARFDDESSSVIDAFEPVAKYFLILINPAGGKGKAEQMTTKSVLPVMHEAGFTFEQIITRDLSFSAENQNI